MWIRKSKSRRWAFAAENRRKRKTNKSKRRKTDNTIEICLCHALLQKSNKGAETSTNIDKHNGLSEFDITETAQENKEEDNNNDIFKLFADDIVAEEESENEMETKMEKWKWQKKEGLKWAMK